MKTSQKIIPGQTLIDMAIQELGDASRAFEIAVMNDMSITDDLLPGTVLLLPEPEKDKRSLVQLFTSKPLAPASADTAQEMSTTDEGIEFWRIENDFIIQ